MKQINQKFLTGERALFQGKDLKIYDTTFADGESPLKESRNIELYRSMFKWKYPLWYSHNIKMEDCVLFEMGRAGIWYTENISMKNCIVEAPKNFRRTTGIELERVTMPNAGETLWNCYQIRMDQVSAKGDYFAMNSSNLYIDGFELVGNYSFDGVKNAEIHHARLLSKDAFWNSENVTVYDCNGVQREHNKKLNNGLPILHKVPPKRDYGRYFCIMAEKGGTSHGGLTEKLSPFFHAKKQEVNAYGR